RPGAGQAVPPPVPDPAAGTFRGAVTL
ncbi:hypothetical protein ATR1_174c0001, partial [Acetobacter tropicalis]